ncbi:mono-functional DNA-alkylating methyl methanesulfonate N-term-domain-containing protein [Rhypophila decipiens]|uniref:Mono-functional DNA-alkylating methyl methanesulfonate N-term-domain-containing protein n=1 Tax=Rhypophila decipiens TaxID=261697 RepID=A0AAN6Y3S5_9PEZI|nr:mono-functional DNA-alkylating methyl methanesulfonate N-term-domain-containing protein [Rhypophila decipiens]
MAFQTSFLRNGEWVTETLSVQALIKANSSSAKASKKPLQLQAPQCGILTQTAFESQQVNLILPVRLRSHRHNDIAFVGNNSVHIFELQPEADGQSEFGDKLVEVYHTSDLPCRIRNAAVIGSFAIRDNGRGQEDGLPKVGASSPPSMAHATPASRQLPPQQLLLVLETGALVFLVAGEPHLDHWTLVPAIHPSPAPEVLYMGFHLAVDPSSRYMVQASHQEYFVVHELESCEKRQSEQYRQGVVTSPVRSSYSRSINGVIHKVVFLYPRPEDVNHVILLLIIVRNAKSRMVIYDWEVGDDMEHVFADEKQGYGMPADTQFPVLVIPLTVRSAFVTISSPNTITVWTGALHGPPSPEAIDLEYYPPTSIHHGKGVPLWTTWARPLRLPEFFNSLDFIYLARDDGVVIYLQADKDAEIRSNKIATLDCNISNAFASVYHRWTDALLVGGASGPGGIWLAPPREKLTQLASLPSAAPTLDFVTDQGQEVISGRVDRIFSISGCGTKGAITEHRYGLKATVEFEWDYRRDVKHAWLLPSHARGDPDGRDLLLSYPDSTSGVHFEADFENAADHEGDPNRPYDYSSTTLALQCRDGLIVQVTAQYVTLLAAAESKAGRLSIDQLLGGPLKDASIRDNFVAFSAEADSCIMVYEIDVAQLSLVHKRTFIVEGVVNCLALTDHSVVAAVWKDEKPVLATFVISTHSPLPPREDIDLLATLASSAGQESVNLDGDIEPIASIVCVGDQILLGTRSGEVITISRPGLQSTTINIQKFGMTTAYLTCRQSLNPQDETVLICCGGRVIFAKRLTSYSPPRTQHFEIFPVYPDDLGGAISDVSFVVPLDWPSKVPGYFYALIASGERFRFVTVTTEPGPVQRPMSIAGAPTRCMYSRELGCLVVAVSHEDKPTLRFIDPDTGRDLGLPTDRDGITLPFISGLGKTGDRILGLEQWRFEKDGKTWEYVLVATHSGRLMVVDTVKSKDQSHPIRYRTRFTHKEPGVPIYAVLGCGDGLIYCAGSTVYCDLLDHETKKLRRLKSFGLPSPAISLHMANGKLMALTTKDSLLVVDHFSMDDSNAPSLCHSDPKTRNGTHMIELGAGTQPAEAITLVGDRDCGVGGLWVPWQLPLKDCESVYEAELTGSIRRFRRGHIRPPWEGPYHQPKYGRLLSTPDDADILGISLDGSVQYFTLIAVDTWRLLRFVQNLAEKNLGQVNRRLAWWADPGTSRRSPDPGPKMAKGLEMHVNGDILRLCVESRALERLLVHPVCHRQRFMELMDALVGGQRTPPLCGIESYTSLAYDIIEYFVKRPFGGWDMKYNV